MRVLASHGDPVDGPPWIYRAAAYEHDGRSQEPAWVCEHDHQSAQLAFLCGLEWLESAHADRDSQGAA
jgi:hypothetical protein